jgi:TPP-dependent pyruvate/acetoin dehydrogenase alpha subunit
MVADTRDKRMDLRGFDFHFQPKHYYDLAGVDAHGCWWVVRPAEGRAVTLYEVRCYRYGQHGSDPWPWDRARNVSQAWKRFEDAVEALAAHLAALAVGEGI